MSRNGRAGILCVVSQCLLSPVTSPSQVLPKAEYIMSTIKWNITQSLSMSVIMSTNIKTRLP